MNFFIINKEKSSFMLQQLLKISIVSTKLLSLFHFKRIYNQFQSSVHPNTYSTAYIVHQKAWKIAASKSYIFQNFSFLLLLSYHTFVPKKFRLDEKRSFVTNALKTRFAYIRPVSFSSAIPCFFFFFFFVIPGNMNYDIRRRYYPG